MDAPSRLQESVQQFLQVVEDLGRRGEEAGPPPEEEQQDIAVTGEDGPDRLRAASDSDVGNGAAAGPKNVLFFTAGPNDESDGLFGSLTPIAPQDK